MPFYIEMSVLLKVYDSTYIDVYVHVVSNGSLFRRHCAFEKKMLRKHNTALFKRKGFANGKKDTSFLRPPVCVRLYFSTHFAVKLGVHDVKFLVTYVVIYAIIYAIILVWCPLQPVIYRKSVIFAVGKSRSRSIQPNLL